MTPRPGVATAPRPAAPGRPAAAWSLPFDPLCPIGTDSGDHFDQLADPPGPASGGTFRRGLRVAARSGVDLPLFALLDGWLSVVTGAEGDAPVLLLTVDQPKALGAWPRNALAGPPAFVAYTGIDPEKAEAMLAAMIEDGFVEGTRRMAFTTVGKATPLSAELDRQFARSNGGAPAKDRTAQERRDWIAKRLPELLKTLTAGVWVAAGETVGLAEPAGAPQAEVLIFDRDGLPIDPRGCLGRLADLRALPALTEVPAERRAALGLVGEPLPLLVADQDGNVRLPAEAGTAALRRGHPAFQTIVRGTAPARSLALSSELRITARPAAKPFSTVEGWPVTRAPADGESGLLAEAVRCFGHTDANVTRTRKWPSLADRTTPEALDAFRLRLHDRTVALLTALVKVLAKPNEVVREFNPGQASQRGGEVPGHLRGRYAVRALIAPQWRHPRASAALRDRARSAGTRVRRFEELAPALAELRALAARPRVEAALTAAFGPAVVTPWGGTAAIARAGRDADAGGYQALGLEVGLTEKLYDELATAALLPPADAKASGVPRTPITATRPGATPFRLHIDIAEKSDVILNEILPPDGLPPEWRTLLAAVDTMEGRFLKGCETGGPLAVAVGLPWGVALAAVLRAYLVELAGRLLTVALPIDFAYHRIDGYLGVAMSEAITGVRAVSAQGAHGYLTTAADDPLLTALSGWRVEDFTTAWPAAGPIHDGVAKRLTEMAAKPFLLVDGTKNKGEPVGSGTAADLRSRRPTFPPFSAPGPRLTNLPLFLHTRLSAQGRLFVAAQILQIAIRELGLSATVELRKVGKTNHTVDAGAASRLTAPATLPGPAADIQEPAMGASSYAWGGQHPPHSTHRDGETFDISFGPDSLPWPAADDELAALVKTAAAANKTFTELQLTYRASADGTAAVSGPLIFRGAVTAVLKQQFGQLTAFLNSGAVTGAERAAYDRIEAVLSGTPHFFFSRSAQQVQTSIVAMLLAGSDQIISGSPIAHLRAIRAIREGVATADPEFRGTVSQLLRESKPVFMAHNHYNHLHVEFAKSSHPRVATTPERDAELFARDLDLWIRLGIDLRPLLAHYEGLVLNDDEDVAQVVRERQLLVDALRARSADLAPTLESRRRLWAILVTLSAEGTLVRPAQANRMSTVLEQIVKETQEAVGPVIRGRNVGQSFPVADDESGEDQE